MPLTPRPPCYFLGPFATDASPHSTPCHCCRRPVETDPFNETRSRRRADAEGRSFLLLCPDCLDRAPPPFSGDVGLN